MPAGEDPLTSSRGWTPIEVNCSAAQNNGRRDLRGIVVGFDRPASMTATEKLGAYATIASVRSCSDGKRGTFQMQHLRHAQREDVDPPAVGSTAPRPTTSMRSSEAPLDRPRVYAPFSWLQRCEFTPKRGAPCPIRGVSARNLTAVGRRCARLMIARPAPRTELVSPRANDSNTSSSRPGGSPGPLSSMLTSTRLPLARRDGYRRSRRGVCFATLPRGSRRRAATASASNGDARQVGGHVDRRSCACAARAPSASSAASTISAIGLRSNSSFRSPPWMPAMSSASRATST